MNLGAPRARMLIGPKGPCRWRSNGHLLRCQSVLRAHVLVGAPFMAPNQEGVINHAPTVRFSLRLASDHCFATCKEPMAGLALAPLACPGS
jgi:hypothetical protein